MEIIASEASRRSGNMVVFDYGAGRGGGWPDLLRRYPHVELVCYEPQTESRLGLAKNLAGLNARICGDDPAEIEVQADFIVSFSVLEHVRDRAAYLRFARQTLKPDGVFFLNFDDGHFRNRLELEMPSTWPHAVREWTVNRLAPVLPYLGLIGRYQKRVDLEQLERLIQEAGLVISEVRFENLADLKALSKTVTPDKQDAFLEFWISIEDRLNQDFCVAGPVARGGSANLWQACPSVTYRLTTAHHAAR